MQSALGMATKHLQKEPGSPDYILHSFEMRQGSDGLQEVCSNNEKRKIPGTGGGGRRKKEESAPHIKCFREDFRLSSVAVAVSVSEGHRCLEQDDSEDDNHRKAAAKTATNGKYPWQWPAWTPAPPPGPPA